MSEHNEQTNAEQQPEEFALEGERGIPPVGAPTPTSPGKKKLVAFVMLSVVGGLGAIYYWKKQQPALEEAAAAVKGGIETLSPRSFDEPPPLAPPSPRPSVLSYEEDLPDLPRKGDRELLLLEEEPASKKKSGGGGGAPRPRAPTLDKGRSSLMVSGAGGSAPAAQRVQTPQEYVASLMGAPSAAGAVPPEALAGLGGASPGGASPSRPSGNSSGAAGLSASFLGDRNFILAQGSFIECVLQTRLDSTVPGMTSCVVARNIYSDNGKVLLVERGSTVSGEYQSDIQQGQARIFVLWNRIKTPNGVVVSLDSPATDPLGGAGIPGKVNNHFFARFGSALLLSLVDDLAGAAVASLAPPEGQTFNFGNTASGASGAAQEVIKSTIQIKPTLTKNQGELVGIYVAKDLDFSGVYRVTN